LFLSMLTLAALGSAALGFAQTATRPQTPPTRPAPDVEDKLVHVLMTTSKGDIVLQLNREKAPISVANFLGYVDKKFYDGTIFHRIVKRGPQSMIDVIQGGGFTPDMVQKPTDKPIKNEWQNGLTNDRGTISMARTPAPDSATTQFFINIQANPMLDKPDRAGAAYAVFGKIVAGMDVAEAIQNVPTTTKGPHQGVPVDPVEIKSVTRLTADDVKRRIDAEKSKSANS
jgi:cyclophilin family peptidyl-prolyl cis-trans isomerase